MSKRNLLALMASLTVVGSAALITPSVVYAADTATPPVSAAPAGTSRATVMAVAQRFADGDGTSADYAWARSHPKLANQMADASKTGADEATQIDTRADLAPMAATNCHTIDRYFVANSPLGVQLYKYHTYLQWCENGTKITSTPAHYGYFSNVDGLDERVVTANLANEVQPLNPSTYAIWTKGEIENCIFHYGCIGTKYPQQKIWYYAGRGITNTRYYNPDDGRGWRS